MVATPRSPEPPGDTVSSANAVSAYSRQWEWDEAVEDYICTTGKSFSSFSLPFRVTDCTDDGRRLMYTAYQRSGGKEAESELKPRDSGPSSTQKNTAKPPGRPPSKDEQGWVNGANTQLLRSPSLVLAAPRAVVRQLLPPPKKAYEGDLPDGILSFSIYNGRLAYIS